MSDQRIPISQLSETQTAPDASYIAIDDGSLTKKITVENFNSTSTASAQQYANQAAASAQTVEDNIATSAAQIREATLAAREATQASTAATASATSAYDSASLAQNYSVNAATSAGQAMNAADTVAQGVTESKEYAEDSEAWAVGKRNGSDVPATDDTYHNNAKYYSDRAVTAATSAESDADRAEAAADSINLPDSTLTVSGTAADSKAAGDGIRALFDAYETGTASGTVVTFDDGASGAPLKQMVAGITLEQDLHGYDHPWAGGTGKNKWKFGDVELANAVKQMLDAPLPAGDYHLSCVLGSGVNTWLVRFYYADGSGSVTCLPNSNVTLPQECDGVTWARGPITQIQLEAGTSATDYEPYANICPITGYTGVTFTRTDGENPPGVIDTFGVTFPTEAGTVCSGTLTVNEDGSGTLVVDTVAVLLDGSEQWKSGSTNIFYLNSILPNFDETKVWSEDHTNSLLVLTNETNNTYYNYNQIRSLYPCVALRNTGYLFLGIGENYSTVEQCTAWLAEHPLQVAYYITPTTYYLTAPVVKTILGTNSISMDAAGTMTVDYFVDFNKTIEDLHEEIEYVEDSLTNELGSIVYKDEHEYVNPSSHDTVASGDFGVFFEELTYVKSILPDFTNISGTGTVTIYKTDGPVEAGKTVTAVDTFTFNIGDTITFNRFFDVDTIAVIHGNENAVLRYIRDASTATINARIGRIYNSKAVSQTLPDNRFGGTFTILEPVDLSDVSSSVLFKEQILTGAEQDTARANINAASMSDVTPVVELMDQVYSHPKEYTNTATTNSTANANFGFWFEKTTYVESVLPTFSAEAGTGTVYIYRAYNAVDKNATVVQTETFTFTIGQPITFNRYFGPDDLVIIHGNADSVLKFVNNVNVPLNVRIARISAAESTTTITSVLATSRFAGVFTIKEAAPDHLLDKKLMAIGDSMVYGHTLKPARSWTALVGADLGMEVDNRGTNGARMANYQYNSKDNSVYQKVCVSTSEFYISTEDLQAAEVIIICAGTNDCNHSITIGDVDSTDPLEFCGAINLICQELQTRAPQSKIAFITPYKRAGVEAQCQQYIDAILAVCDKYSIPVFDNGKNGGICWSNAAITGAMALDTFHLNDAGMKYVSTKYESFIKSL